MSNRRKVAGKPKTAAEIVGTFTKDDREQDKFEEHVEERLYDFQVDEEARGKLEGIGRLVVTHGRDVQERAVEWVWDQRLPLGTLCLAAGKGSSGKSTFCVDNAAQATNGTLDGCWKGDPRGVLWVGIEASWEVEVKPRLRAAGADIDRYHFVKVEVGNDPADAHIRIFDPAFVERLRDLVEELDIGLIVLDPMLDVLSGRLKTSEQKAVRSALARINTFAEQMEILILGICHFNKMSSVADAIDRITDSAAFTQRPRAVLVFAYDEDEGIHVVSQAKNNWGPRDLPHLAFSIEEVQLRKPEPITTVRLVWQGESEDGVNDILGRKRPKQSRVDETARVIEATLRKHDPDPIPSKDVMAAIKDEIGTVGSNTLQMAKEQVGVVIKRALEKQPGTFWALPEY